MECKSGAISGEMASRNDERRGGIHTAPLVLRPYVMFHPVAFSGAFCAVEPV